MKGIVFCPYCHKRLKDATVGNWVRHISRCKR